MQGRTGVNPSLACQAMGAMHGKSWDISPKGIGGNTGLDPMAAKRFDLFEDADVAAVVPEKGRWRHRQYTEGGLG
jgi:hypothetical protein